MTKPIDHYAEAERCIRMAVTSTADEPNLLAVAQVHATLACAPDHTVCGEIADAVRDEYNELRQAVLSFVDMHDAPVTAGLLSIPALHVHTLAVLVR